MKIVIDIPEERYSECIKRNERDTLSLGVILIQSVQNSTPLEKVFEDIKADIDGAYVKVENDYDQGRNYGLYMATQIIYKHISGEEE